MPARMQFHVVQPPWHPDIQAVVTSWNLWFPIEYLSAALICGICHHRVQFMHTVIITHGRRRRIDSRCNAYSGYASLARCSIQLDLELRLKARALRGGFLPVQAEATGVASLGFREDRLLVSRISCTDESGIRDTVDKSYSLFLVAVTELEKIRLRSYQYQGSDVTYEFSYIG